MNFDNQVDESYIRVLNDYFTGVETQLEDVVSRTGAGPNTLLTDLDMNSYKQVKCQSSDCVSLEEAI